jgi:hypothetical protein
MIAGEANGVVAAATGHTPEGWSQPVELLLLPLAQRGNTHSRMIGSIAPIGVPFWLGVSRMGALAIGNVRHLSPALEGPTVARLVAGNPSAARRAAFTVYEGGRT